VYNQTPGYQEFEAIDPYGKSHKGKKHKDHKDDIKLQFKIKKKHRKILEIVGVIAVFVIFIWLLKVIF
jgi:hypothetical protein